MEETSERRPSQQRAKRTAVQSALAAPAAGLSWRWWLVAGTALVVLNVVIYAQVVHYDFVQLDDPTYVSENAQVAAGLTWDSVRWAFTTLNGGYWIPLTWLSYMADVQLFGMNAGALHATNVALHILNTLFLLWLLFRLTRAFWPSALVAGFFAAHPMHVESVAWVTERKDVLSMLFGMAAIALYVKWLETPEVERGTPNAGSRKRKGDVKPRGDRRTAVERGWWYVALVLAFVASLMAKPMLVTLPVLLLLLDFWPLGRLSALKAGPSADGGGTWVVLRGLIWEKLPLFAIAAFIGVGTALAQHPASLDAVPLIARVQNAAVACVGYLGKMFWPAHLSPLYLLPPTMMQSQWKWLGGVSAVPLWKAAGSLALLAAVTLVTILAGRRRPYLCVGWLWYICTLLPVSGLVQSGPQLMADRFTYVPLVGIAMMLAWGLAEVVATFPRSRSIVAASAALAVTACAATAKAQVPVWENSVTFWTRATQDALHVDAFDAHIMLGEILHKQGRLDEARAHFLDAIRLRSGSARAHHGLGRVLADQNAQGDAVPEFEKAVALDARSADAENDLGAALVQTGRVAEAKVHLAEAVRLNPSLAEARRNLGSLLVASEQWAEAIPHLAEAVRLKPELEPAHQDLGIALAETHRFAEAIREFDETLRLNPRNEVARRARAELSSKMR